ncbi:MULTISPECIES: transketolase C-terminal domain-containing protein [unclassified Breznakia]|uniref:transketolase family protein n=1 Tax=unclassified Breznakia TaxID=2623764 RepID=UPI002475F839|nr:MULTISPECIES: transketolase C-terminal domain-containing protein [unclassified Breznakia]MDH6366997.1 transketolase [Breznakia sp. PH1-1]MDH6404231.1 transketolase [Breznakia sp. PF1-11]MDH6411884.1 transketolase [Breznakia sp. PFB1-11]MDH6414219.1 transketolase [Breznakia sp. PFB1-14]MDH6415957.1 transketolase [Breznakia sp. PFB1-4]
MSTITNRQAICDVLVDKAKNDKDIVVVCSDSRGSASLATFASTYPKQFVEVGIAEQNLVGISAGLASCNKKVFAASPASFISTRSYEQVKVDVAYSNTNVTLIGISGGVSYGALGMTHHSCQDFAAMCALTGMRVYCPSDRFQTTKLMQALLEDDKPAYIRVSRSATEDVYDEAIDFQLDKANVIQQGTDVVLIACGEMVPYAKKAAKQLEALGISTGLIDMYCLKPFDQETLFEQTKQAKLVVSIEEHAPQGGLGSFVAQALSMHQPKRMIQLCLPDEHLISGTNKEMFAYYGLDEDGIVKAVQNAL